MSHYWASDTPTEIRREMAMDWLDDLREFGPDIVSGACGAWRRSQTRRPTPADIRALCIREREEHSSPSDHLALPSPEQRRSLAERRIEQNGMRRARDEEARLHRENWAHELGYDSFGQMMSIGLVNAVRNAPGATGKSLSAADHGVRAREWTAEDLAKGRRELGLEK